MKIVMLNFKQAQQANSRVPRFTVTHLTAVCRGGFKSHPWGPNPTHEAQIPASRVGFEPWWDLSLKAGPWDWNLSGLNATQNSMISERQSLIGYKLPGTNKILCYRQFYLKPTYEIDEIRHNIHFSISKILF